MIDRAACWFSSGAERLEAAITVQFDSIFGTSQMAIEKKSTTPPKDRRSCRAAEHVLGRSKLRDDCSDALGQKG
jgi:hypothetical protein